MFATLGTRLIAWLMLGTDMPRSGSRDLLTAPVNVYGCADADVYIQAGTNSLFPKLCRAIGRQDLLEHEEYRTVPGRMAHAEVLEKAVSEWAAPRTSDEIGEVLEEAGIPFAKVSTIPEVAASPQIAAREMVVEAEHPALGTIRMPGNPVKMDKSPPTVRKAPPTVGEDNDHVYGTILGMTPEEVRALGEDGAI